MEPKDSYDNPLPINVSLNAIPGIHKHDLVTLLTRSFPSRLIDYK